MFAHNLFFDVTPHPSPPFLQPAPDHSAALSIPAYSSVEHPQPLRIISSSLHTIRRRAMMRDMWGKHKATESIRWVIDETDRRRSFGTEWIRKA